MAKAIMGAAVLAADVGLAFIGGVTGNFELTMLAVKLFPEALAAAGALEAGAIADALSNSVGTSVTTRQPAAYRQIVYGTRQVPGVMVYQSTTGGNHDQYNMVIVLAGHPCYAIQNLYLDGRRVYWQQGSVGNTTQNGFNFGGHAADTGLVGPDGNHYNFGGLVYCEARYGTQSLGDVIGGLTANDPVWAAGPNGSPSLVGCTYVYLKVEYDSVMFPQQPQIRFTVSGRDDIYDPRTGTTGFTENWALCVADVLTNTDYGLGIPQTAINTDQLIAAANVCDEQVTLAAGGSEKRYTCNWTGDTSLTTGDILSQMMTAAAGRISYASGQWYIYPAYWQGPSFSFDQSSLTAAPTWNPNRSSRDLFNRVKGTYIAPWYPYSVAGNLYDSNGFDANGNRADAFNLAWQPTDYPYYAQDSLHGYAADQWLTEDGGKIVYTDLNQTACISVATAQRVAKIKLLRNRYQGSGTFPMMLDAWKMQPADVMNFNFPLFGWTGKQLEINSVRFLPKAGDEQTAPSISIEVDVNETDPSIYEWEASEELSVYDVPVVGTNPPAIVASPTNVSLESDAATAVTGADGVTLPRILVSWDTPEDAYVRQIQIQYQLSGASVWTDAGLADVGSFSAYISNVVSGQTYNVRIRSLRANGAASDWVEMDNFVVGTTISTVVYSGIPITITSGTLTAIALSNGTAQINITNFTGKIGSISLAFTPNPSSLTGLAQGALYYVYFIDPTFVAGTITPIATQNQADYLDKAGYLLIGSVTTPTSSSAFKPSSYSDLGTQGTLSPASAYDNNIETSASVGAQWRASSPDGSDLITAFGDCVWSGFAAITTTTAMTLNVVVSTAAQGTGGTTFSMQVIAHVNGTTTTMSTFTTATAQTTLTLPVPSGTNLSSVSVECVANINPPANKAGSGSCSLNDCEIWIS